MEDEGFQDGSRHIPEASTSSLDLRPRPEHDLVHALVNANHSHLVERGGAKELLQRRDNEPTAWPEQWMAILAEPDASRRRDLAYLLMLSLPTPALSDLQARVRPLVKLDLLTLLPEEVSRHILAQLEVKAVLNASRVCRAWRTLIWDDQLLWRALYERQGWAYDQAAVEWWNAQAVYAPLSPRVSRSSIPCAVSPDEGMALNEEETALGLLSPPKRREDASDVAKSDGRASPIGLPPSPRHRGFPALRSSPSPTPTGYNDDMLDVVPSRIPLPASPRRINGLPLRRPLRRSSTMTSTKSTTSSPKKRSSPPSPAGFDASRVSRIHYDREGRPWICWRHLFMARTLLDRNWRHGIFEMHELQKPMLRFPSSAPAPPSTHPPNTPYADGVYAIQFDGDRLVAGLRGGMAIRFDLRTGKPMRTYRFHTQSVLCLQYDTPETRLEGEGERLVTGSSDGYAVIWDLESGKVLHALHGHTQSVLSVRFCGDTLATCSKDRNIVLWRMSDGHCMHTLYGHRSAVNALCFQNGVIVSASGDREVRIWSATTGECLRTLYGHQGGIAALAFDGHYIATGSSDSTIRLTDVVSGACLVEIGTPDPAGDRFRTAYQPGSEDLLAIWAAGDSPGLPPILGHAHTDLVRTLSFDSRFIVTGSVCLATRHDAALVDFRAQYDETIKIWDRKNGMLLLDIHAHTTRVFNLQFDVSRLISCSQAGVDEIRVFDFLPDVDVSFLRA